MKALYVFAALLLLPGCSFFSTVPAGTVTGLVLYNGEPAAGKKVSLIGSDKKATTDASGRYTFTGVAAGTNAALHDTVGQADAKLYEAKELRRTEGARHP